jgi:hypothetical protein
MGSGYYWSARWQDPLTHLPSGISRGGFPNANDARDDALRYSPMGVGITIRSPDGSIVQVIPSRRAVAPRLAA